MIRITSHDNITSLAGGSLSEMLYPSYKWAGCIDDFSGTFLEFALYLRGDSVRTNHVNRVGVSFFGRVDRRNTLSAESLHFLCVVNERSKRANRAHAFFHYFFHHFDGAFDAKT